eukprot:TRINITY_DN74889_c0_g1_i1.p1 TRINITY_DN74889_c0_g1~~TRINITY_DN74889_c0_g1_i1.p1  ORF type:complete len:566 (-),score=135.33 TRINITY_DN74889_c0_g1_i1:219-1916(-)
MTSHQGPGEPVWQPVGNSMEATETFLVLAAAQKAAEEQDQRLITEKRDDEDETQMGDGCSTQPGDCSSTRSGESDSEEGDHGRPGCRSGGSVLERQKALQSVSASSSPAGGLGGPEASLSLVSLSREALLRLRFCACEFAGVDEASRLVASSIETGKLRSCSGQSAAGTPGHVSSQISFGGPPKQRPSKNADVLPEASTMSWAASCQRQAVGQDGSPDSRGEMLRSTTSLLNKLTVEKFEELYLQILACAEKHGQHTDVLASEILGKAAMQQSFANMYAQLCARLVVDLGEEATGADFRSWLLFFCRQLYDFSWHWQVEHEDPEAAGLHKKRALGNLRFLGELLVNGVLPTSELFHCARDLMAPPLLQDRLEGAALLLRVVGPTFDTEAWRHHQELKELFWDLHGFTFDFAVQTRVRYLLRDVVELRQAGWVDSKAMLAAVRPQPQRLDEVRKEAGKSCRGQASTGSGREAAAVRRQGGPSLPASPRMRPVDALRPGMADMCLFANWSLEACPGEAPWFTDVEGAWMWPEAVEAPLLQEQAEVPLPVGAIAAAAVAEAPAAEAQA